MLKQKTYSCGICNSKPDQISHHKSHLDTQKHKDKKELFELKLSKLTVEELKDKYNSTHISEIVSITETIENDKKLNNLCNIELLYNNEYMNITDETMSISNKFFSSIFFNPYKRLNTFNAFIPYPAPLFLR